MAHDHVSALRVWPCDGCGGAHIGRWIVYRYFEGTETDFEWTDWQGKVRTCPECGKQRDPCGQQDECWWCTMKRKKART